MKPLILKRPQDVIFWRGQNSPDLSVGFVPTMGALHSGHETLLQKSVDENQITVLSIFVNPTQFNNSNDLENYPKKLEKDLELATKLGVNVVWTPQYEDMYPDGYRFRVHETKESLELEGASRPGHFEGVLTIVMKLLLAVRPTRAYFGEKDFQQLRLVTEMTKSFFLPIEIVPVPTVREEDGLALSSRNQLLTKSEKALAPQLHKILTESTSVNEAIANLQFAGLEVDYIEEKWGRRLAAARLGKVRLIDNVEL